MLRHIFVNVVGTLLRALPFPCRVGIVRIGNPDKLSPVFLTCNYCVTVERVKRVLKKSGIDCYLLVANSNGINVWCSAAGGHFTNHDVISILKTSGIEDLVDHRDVILPQLAAAGIEARVVKEKTGWNVIWGPVYAKDIPEYIRNGFRKSPEMREVKFPILHRIEMAVMWAFPFSVIASILAYFLWRTEVLKVFALSWMLPIFVFALFPYYSKILVERRNVGFSKYTVVFDFGVLPTFFEFFFMLAVVIYAILTGMNFETVIRWCFLSLIVFLLLSIDLMGSTPIYKSGLHEERLLKVELDDKKCTGCGTCVEVCPRNCFEVDKKKRVARILQAEKCVKCAACIVQCPLDALYFKNGGKLLPETVRRFKLNLFGQRILRV